MQFFLPSLIALIIAAIIVFGVLPRLAGPILVGVSVLILVFALYQHITLFKTEYALSTWQDQLKFYAPFVMIAGLLLSVLVYLGVLGGGSVASAPLPLPAPLPPANTATNPLTAALNTGIRAINSATEAVGAPFAAITNNSGTNSNNKNNTKNNRAYFAPTVANNLSSYFSPV